MSLRYGTVPIVRETGGLKDTVEAYNEYEHTGTGFSFANYNAHEMLNIIRYANISTTIKSVSGTRSWTGIWRWIFPGIHPQENTRSCTTGCWATRECSLEETMEIWNEILGNQVLVCSVAGWTVARS